MPNYRRPHIADGTYFITQVTYQRQPWLCCELARTALRVAIESVRQEYPFSIDAFVLLHDHFHCIWTWPPGDSRYSILKNSDLRLYVASSVNASDCRLGPSPQAIPSHHE